MSFKDLSVTFCFQKMSDGCSVEAPL